MASFNFKVPAAWRGSMPSPQGEPTRALRSQKPSSDEDEGTSLGCHESSWELARGLEVLEAGMSEWQEAWRRLPVPPVASALSAPA